MYPLFIVAIMVTVFATHLSIQSRYTRGHVLVCMYVYVPAFALCERSALLY